MQKNIIVIRCLKLGFFSFFLFSISVCFGQSRENDIQTVVHLLSYVSTDYPQAVKEGKVINQQEYEEQKEFSNQAYQLAKNKMFVVGQDNGVLSDLLQLKKLIEVKASGDSIHGFADRVRSKIIVLTGIRTAPSSWPDIAKGRKLYTVKCMDCHGAKGDGLGSLAGGLDPSPSNFLDRSLMSKVSPYQAYSTIKLGVPGTPMRSFPELSEEELWDLAFYIKSLPYQKEVRDSQLLKKAFGDALTHVGLAKVATLADNELLDTLKGYSANAEVELDALRSLTPSGEQLNNSLLLAMNLLNGALKDYNSGNKNGARTNALNAYLEGIEPVEARLRTIDPGFVAELEQQMLKARQAIDRDKGTDVVSAEVHKALDLISRAQQLMQDQKLNYWLTFILALSIVLREGLEAFLILAVVLALIRSTGVKKAIPWLHGGWILALALGVAGWYLSDFIIQFGGKNREIMEGLVSLLAVIVLLFVGFWLHDKSHAKQWKEFVEKKIGKLLQKDKMIGLAAFSFVIVFREAFEVILFLRAISLEATSKNQSAIGLGLLAAFVLIGVIAYLFLNYSKKIPIRQLFRYSSWIIILLSVILIGKGVHSMQESGWVTATGVGLIPQVDWLGIYPTIETLLAQVALLAIVFLSYYFNDQKRRKEQVVKS